MNAQATRQIRNKMSLQQVLCFGHYTLSCFLLKQYFGDWILSPSSGKNLLSWAQSIELVPISGPDLLSY
jgi:hypothetical protein